MTQLWKSNDELTKLFGMTAHELKLEDLKEKSPHLAINQYKKYCPICLNAETSIRGVKKINKIISKPYCKKVFRLFLAEPEKKFTVREIIRLLGAEDLSNGDLQRKALSALVAKGHIKKERFVWINKKGITKEKHIFIYNQEGNIPDCYDIQSDCHINNWKDGILMKKEEIKNENFT